MASDTVPVAADGPNTPPDSTPSTATGTQPATPTGGLSDLLAPVQPARFTLDPAHAGDTPTAAGTDDTTGLTSADYHQQNTKDETQTSNSTNGTGKAQQSIWRAWWLAGAERWKKGADARLKALDIKKARAQALQVKESRTVNRSEKFVGGNTSSGTSTQNNAGKSLNNKASQARKDGAGPKNSSGPKNPSGRGNSGHGHVGPGRGGGRSSSGGGAGTRTHGGRGTDSRKTPSNGPSGKDTSSPKRDTNTPAKPEQGKPHDRSGSGSKGPNGRSNGSSGGNAGASGRGTASGKPGAPGATGKDGKPGKDTTGPNKPDKPASKLDLVKKLTPNKPSAGEQPHDRTTSPQRDKPGPPAAPGTLGKGLWKDKLLTGNDSKEPLKTQASRETGYRDGARAAGAANHVLAYRDGVRDGWNDHREHGRREAQQLDHAHTRRKQERQTGPQPKTVKVPPMPTHAPTNHGPQPIQVTGVSNTGITLGNGADRTHISHGEVRSLKQFERALGTKSDTMARIAEGSRLLKAHADQQLKHVTWLTEQARIVEGGDQLLSALLKLEEAAKVQAMAADEIVTRAVRAHEACTVLLANVDTRYGGIYKAVVDSGLIAPADLHYYKDTAHAV